MPLCNRRKRLAGLDNQDVSQKGALLYCNEISTVNGGVVARWERSGIDDDTDRLAADLQFIEPGIDFVGVERYRA